jgi:hypothetical protein
MVAQVEKAAGDESGGQIRGRMDEWESKRERG